MKQTFLTPTAPVVRCFNCEEGLLTIEHARRLLNRDKLIRWWDSDTGTRTPRGNGLVLYISMQKLRPLWSSLLNVLQWLFLAEVQALFSCLCLRHNGGRAKYGDEWFQCMRHVFCSNKKSHGFEGRGLTGNTYLHPCEEPVRFQIHAWRS